MKTLLLATACLAAAVALSGCGANSLGQLANNQNCTLKVSGEASFGSMTPTGKAKWSALCKTATAPPAEKVADPAPDAPVKSN